RARRPPRRRGRRDPGQAPWRSHLDHYRGAPAPLLAVRGYGEGAVVAACRFSNNLSVSHWRVTRFAGMCHIPIGGSRTGHAAEAWRSAKDWKVVRANGNRGRLAVVRRPPKAARVFHDFGSRRCGSSLATETQPREEFPHWKVQS